MLQVIYIMKKRASLNSSHTHIYREREREMINHHDNIMQKIKAKYVMHNFLQTTNF